jgi:hypothetical protein
MAKEGSRCTAATGLLRPGAEQLLDFVSVNDSYLSIDSRSLGCFFRLETDLAEVRPYNKQRPFKRKKGRRLGFQGSQPHHSSLWVIALCLPNYHQ